MSMEMPSSAETSLASFFEKFSIEDQNTLSNDILIPIDAPDSVLENITDMEVARELVTRFKQYLQWKEEGVSKQDLKKEAQDIGQVIDNQFEQADSRQAA